jgi:transitional endoplasmic reticulum ATPase
MATNDSTSAQSYSSFKDHCRGTRTSTRLQVLESLRDAYPEHHITCVDRKEYDFLGYAKQGHARSELLAHSDALGRELIDAKRNYEKPSRLVASASGSLYDSVYFGRYRYTWNEKSFIVYKGVWPTTCVGHEEKVFYVLTPRSETSASSGHCSTTDALLLAVGKWTSVPHDEIYVFDQTYWRKSAELWQSIKGSSWDDVILDPKMKSSLIEDVQGFFDSRALYREFAVPWKRGIILHGVPGNGKTISIKALINYLSEREDPIPSLYVKSFENKCNGPQASVKDIFDHARKMAPCLLVFEDLDSLVSKDVRSYFLNEVDGLDSNDGILMIGSTNHLNSLDPAISKRPSRFDRKYHFKVPSFVEREAYMNYWRAKLAENTRVDFPADISAIIATLTDGFSYAYLKELFVMTLLLIARGGKGLEELVETGWDVVSESSTPGELAAGATEDQIGKDGGEEKQPLIPKKKKNEIPVVDVPEHLKDNVFLRVIQQQVRVLLHEMDNTEEEENALPVLSGDGSETANTSACGQCAILQRQIRAILETKRE